ncbi:MAG: PAS domain S-box protein [Anaerolineae bacterium]
MDPGSLATEQDVPSMGVASRLVYDLATALERIRELESQLDAAGTGGLDALSASGERLRILLGNLQELILVVNPDRKITDVAGNCMGLLGYAESELCGPGVDLDVLHVIDERDRPLVETLIAEARMHPQGSSVAARVMDRAGEERWVDCTLVPLYDEAEQHLTGLQVIFRDISERVRSEQMMHSLNEAAAAVQKASLSLEDVLEAVTGQLYALDLNSAVGLTDPDTGQVAWVKVRGGSRFMQAMDRLAKELPDVALDRVPDVWEALNKGQPAILNLDQAIVAQSDIRPTAARQIAQLLGPTPMVVVPLRAEAHGLGYLAVASAWLSQQSIPAIQAYANQTAIAIRNSRLIGMLADSETQYRAIFESARDGLLVINLEGDVVAASETTCALFGISHAEMIGRSVNRLFTVGIDEIASSCQEGVYGGESASVIAQALRPGSEPFPVEMRGSRIAFAGKVHLIILITDISERIRAQEALIQSERLSALGQMAGGIAHDFNNILVSILGYAQMATEDADGNRERLIEDLAQIEAGARDAADAVSRLQSLYRDSDDRSDFMPIQLDDALMDALALNRPRWKDIPQLQGITYRIETHLERPETVLGNPSELRRVLSNLLINAIDAMPQGGVLTFESRQNGLESIISVRDTGIGIPPEIQQRIFEPFFTTKKSSGLGLTVSANIVKRHNGALHVESEQGQGTCITLRFPVYRPAAVTEAGDSCAAADRTVEPLSVLVIDDEPHVRAVLARVLERQGHHVRTVSNGRDGLASLLQTRYDLLICDLGMPELPGSVVMQRARALDPGMPIILATGWGDTVTPEQLRQMCASALLPKPFGQEDVRRAILAAIETGPVE